MNHLAEKIKKYLEAYVGTVTHTASELENNNIVFFKDYFSSVEYFKSNPQNCGFYTIEKDPLGRKVPWALLKGQGSDTIILIHHTDTVDTDDYGINKELAYKPFLLTEKYLEGNVDLSEPVLDDLKSGEWLFGRGVADMKGGASIHLALLDEYSQDENFQGNLLLLGLPDEENLSAGMRGAVNLLKELKDKHDLNYKLLLNVEPQEREEKDLMRLYDGSVGKLMPIFYARGKLAHVGQVFNGLNPIQILSEIIGATELNPDFSEKVGNTITPPPTWLFSKDRKEVYDVSLPLAATGYMSILTLDRPVVEIMGELRRLSEESFARVLERSNASYKAYLEKNNEPLQELPWKVNVKTYDEVYQEALRDGGDALVKEIDEFLLQAKEKIEKGELSIPEASFQLIEKTLLHLKDTSPLVVLAMAPPYYPNTNISMVPEKGKEIYSLLEKLEAITKDALDCSFHVKNYYTGISDLSYGLFEASQENVDFIENNMLLWGDIYSIPFDVIKALSIPVLNIGPWGKDFHKYTERVYLKDLYDRIPLLVQETIKQLLNN